MLKKDGSEWVKKYMDFVVEGLRPRGRPKRTLKEVVEGDMKSLKLSKEDALVRSKWRLLIRLVMIAGVNVSSCFRYQLTLFIMD